MSPFVGADGAVPWGILIDAPPDAEVGRITVPVKIGEFKGARAAIDDVVANPAVEGARTATSTHSVPVQVLIGFAIIYIIS